METVDVIMRFYKSNPVVMGELLKGEVVDIGHGLSLLICNRVVLEFELFLEGEEIGYLDGELGGWILGCDEEDLSLMDKVCSHMREVFPTTL